MPPKEPRRKKTDAGPMSRALATELGSSSTYADAGGNILKGRVLPELLAHATEDEQRLHRGLQQLSKVNSTTKIKGLAEVEAAVVGVDDGVAGMYVFYLITSLRSHLTHESAQVRAGFYKALTPFLIKEGKEVKRQIAEEIGTVMYTWLCGMYDADRIVREAATACFHACFPVEEKRKVALERSFEKVQKMVLRQLSSALAGSDVPVRDEEGDTRVLSIVSGLGLIGYLLRNHPSPGEVQTLAISLLQSRTAGYLRLSLPLPDKTVLVSTSPKIRGAAVGLLTTIVTCKVPLHQKDFGLVWAVSASLLEDPNPQLQALGWELTLQWLSVHQQEAVTAMPNSFVGLVLNKIGNLPISQSDEGVEALLSSLLPYAAVLSRHPNHSGVVDDICGDLIERVQVLAVRPLGKEYRDIWRAAWECWELHLVRKSSTSEHDHSLELFAVMLAVAVEAIASSTSGGAQRLLTAFQTNVIPVAAKHILKCLNRLASTDTGASKEVVASVIGEVLLTIADKGTCYKVLAHDQHKAILLSFAVRIAVCFYRDGLQGVELDATLKGRIQEWATDLLAGCVTCAGELVESGEEGAADCLLEGVRDFLTVANSSTAVAPFTISDTLQSLITQKLVTWPAFSTDLMPLVVGGSVGASTSNTTNAAVESFVTDLIGELKAGLETLTVQGVKMATAAAQSDAIGAEQLLDIIEMGIPGGVGHECVEACLQSLARRGEADVTTRTLIAKRREGILEVIVRTIGDLYLQGGEGAGPSTVVSRNLTYNNESSGESSSSESSSSSSDDDSDPLSREVSAGVNMGRTIYASLMEWMDLVSTPAFTHSLVANCHGEDTPPTPEALEEALLPFIRALHRMIASVTPLLFGEQFVSLRLMRTSIGSSDEATQSMSLVGTMSRRHHALSATEVEELVDSLEKLCLDDWALPHILERVASDFFQMYFLNVGGDMEHPALASSMLGDLVCRFTRVDTLLFGDKDTFVKGNLLPRLITRTPNVPLLDAGVVPLHTMRQTTDGTCAAIRLGQIASLLVRNKETYGPAALLASHTPAPVVAGIVSTYVRVCALRNAINDRLAQEVREALHALIQGLPPVGSFLDEVQTAVCSTLWDAVAEDLLDAKLLGALGKELGALVVGSDDSEGNATLATASLSAVCEIVVTRIAALTTAQHADARDLFALSSILSDNFRHHCVKLKNETVVAIKKAIAAPSTPLPSVITLLIVFRMDRRRLVVTDDESMALMGRIEKGKVDPSDALALIAELSCQRNTNVHLYTDLCRVAVHWASQNYALHHLPSNGRLGNRPPTSAPLPLRVLRPSVRELVKLSQGLDIHNRKDDTLQSTINLVVFDAALECIYRIRGAQVGPGVAAPALTSPVDLAAQRTTTIAEIVSFVASVLPYLASLNGTKIRSIAASEQSAAVISNALGYVHMWLCSSTVSLLESVGVANILQVVSLVTRVSLVTLASSKIPVHDSVHLVRRRCLVKKLRVLPPQPEIEIHEDENGEPIPVEIAPAASLPPNTVTTSSIVKLPYFKRIQSTIAHTTKQKISVLTYLTSWLCTIGSGGERAMALTSPSEKPFSGRAVKNEVFQLMDLIISLMCTPTNVFSNSSGRRNPDDCYLLLTAEMAEFAVTHGYFDAPLGFDAQALSNLSEAASMPTSNLMSNGIMNVLARGAVTLYSSLIQSPLLVHVRDWLNTVDNSVRILLTTFTSTHLSPIIVQNALLGVMANDIDGKEKFEVEDDYWVAVNLRERRIVLEFEKDDSIISLTILFPAEYPLSSARLPPDTLKSQSKNKVGEANKWRTWVMKISVMLFDGHTNSVWSSIQSFGRLLQQHFDGVDPCPICYSLMDTQHKLPNMSCSTCGNRCHASCLFKWWSTQGGSTCPYCRSPWST